MFRTHHRCLHRLCLFALAVIALSHASSALAQGVPSDVPDFSINPGNQLRADIEGYQARLRNLDVQLQQTLHPPLAVSDAEISKARQAVRSAERDVATMKRQLDWALATNSPQVNEINRVLKLAEGTLAREQGNLNYWQAAKLASTNLGGDIGGFIGLDLEDTQPVKELRQQIEETRANLEQAQIDLRAWNSGFPGGSTIDPISDGPGAPPIDAPPVDFPPIDEPPGDGTGDLLPPPFDPNNNPGSFTDDIINLNGNGGVDLDAPANGPGSINTPSPTDNVTPTSNPGEVNGFVPLDDATPGDIAASGDGIADGKYAIGVVGMKMPLLGDVKGFELHWRNTGSSVAEASIPLPAEIPQLVTGMLGLPQTLKFRMVRQGQSGRWNCDDAAFQQLVKGILVSADALQQEAKAPKVAGDEASALDSFGSGLAIASYKQNATATLSECRLGVHDYGSGELRLGLEGSARVHGTYNGAAVQGDYKFAGLNLTAKRLP